MSTEFEDAYVYGALRIVSEFVGQGQTIATLDADGRLVAKSVPGFQGTSVLTETMYDEFGRVSWASLPHEPEDISQGANTVAYDSLGRLTTLSGPTGLTTTYHQVDYLSATSVSASWFDDTDGAFAVIERAPRGNTC
jgi:hypothetical protein